MFPRGKRVTALETARRRREIVFVGHMKPISGFREYITIYDNDNAGKVGIKKLAERLFIEA